MLLVSNRALKHAASCRHPSPLIQRNIESRPSFHRSRSSRAHDNEIRPPGAHGDRAGQLAMPDGILEPDDDTIVGPEKP